jgi:hypothetical protein
MLRLVVLAMSWCTLGRENTKNFGSIYGLAKIQVDSGNP